LGLRPVEAKESGTFISYLKGNEGGLRKGGKALGAKVPTGARKKKRGKKMEQLPNKKEKFWCMEPPGAQGARLQVEEESTE